MSCVSSHELSWLKTQPFTSSGNCGRCDPSGHQPIHPLDAEVWPMDAKEFPKYHQLRTSGAWSFGSHRVVWKWQTLDHKVGWHLRVRCMTHLSCGLSVVIVLPKPSSALHVFRNSDGLSKLPCFCPKKQFSIPQHPCWCCPLMYLYRTCSEP